MRTTLFVLACGVLLAPAVSAYEVAHTGNSGPGSLRQAILDANATPNPGGIPERIEFNITDPPGAVIRTITPIPDSLLPPITDAVIIDGYTQTGASPNTNDWSTCTSDLGTNAVLMVEIDGSAAGPDVVGLQIQADGCVIQGLAFNKFVDGTAIQLDGCSGTRIEGCFIGLDLDGLVEAGSESGIIIHDAPGNTVGGNTAAARNVLCARSSDNSYAIRLLGWASIDNVIQGNLFGSDLDGLEPLMGHTAKRGRAIYAFQAGENLIGGTVCEERNVIGNHRYAVYLEYSHRNTISMNYIGVNLNGKLDPRSDAIPNRDGILVSTGHDNTIGGDVGNIIAHNEFGVVVVYDSGGNAITQNSITRNDHLGIDLARDNVTANDPLDADIGPNLLQNFPELYSARTIPAVYGPRVAGLMHGAPGTTFRIELFVEPACDVPSLHGEGGDHISTFFVTTDADGNAEFNQPASGASIGDVLTTTATDPDGNTSEFSACAEVTWGVFFEVTEILPRHWDGSTWFLNLPIENLSPVDARSVSGTLSPGPYADWLTVVDPQAVYGTIPGGASRRGGSYALDLEQWPGGSFLVDLQLDYEDGQGTAYSTRIPVLLVIDQPTAVAGHGGPPQAPLRVWSHPNPATQISVIAFDLPRRATVDVAVYNARGQRVRGLWRGVRNAGAQEIEWDGRDGSGRRVASGVYYVLVRAGEWVAAHKQVIIR